MVTILDLVCLQTILHTQSVRIFIINLHKKINVLLVTDNEHNAERKIPYGCHVAVKYSRFGGNPSPYINRTHLTSLCSRPVNTECTMYGIAAIPNFVNSIHLLKRCNEGHADTHLQMMCDFFSRSSLLGKGAEEPTEHLEPTALGRCLRLTDHVLQQIIRGNMDAS
jgi:hypothetical protein